MKISVFNLRNLLLVLFALSLAVTSCKKDEDEEVEEEPAVENPQASAQPNFEAADASLWAVKSITTIDVFGMPVESVMGLAVGVFFNGDSFTPAGTVQCNSNQLDLNPNNSYSFVPGAADVEGISFTGGVTWDVSGGNGFTAFTENVTAIAFPELGEITSSGTIPLSGYTLTTASVSGADSVLFIVGDVMKTLAGSATSCEFTADELSGLEAGTGIAQVAAYTYYSNNIGGKEIYFGNEAVRSLVSTYE